MSLKDFIKKYTGVRCGNTDANFGECVGLVMLWIRELGLSHVWGHAKDIFANAKESEFEKIKNSPDLYPEEGDIIVWDYGTHGHAAIVVSSDKKDDLFTVFEQNNPVGSPPKITRYTNWGNVIGWLHPLVKVKPKENFLDLDIPTEIEEKLKLKSIERYNKHWTYYNILEDWVKLASELDKSEIALKNKALECTERLEKVMSEVTHHKKTIDALELNLGALNATLEAQVRKINELAEFEEKYKNLFKEHEKLCEDYRNLEREIASNYEDTIADLRKRILQLQRPTPTVREALAILVDAIKEVLSNAL